jgi:ubiquinone/menaquinone biosynthesis C-methylase UbiE
MLHKSTHPVTRRLHGLTAAARRLGTRREDAAGDYWARADGSDWKVNSHWRDSPLPDWAGTWDEIGRRHLGMYERFARSYALDEPGRIVEWGVGGGANAVRFAPLAQEFVAVDVVQASLEETARQVRDLCDLAVRPLLVDIDAPSAQAAEFDAAVDLFLCFYVLELVPGEARAHEIVRLAARMLKPGGAAIIQTKYKRSAPKPRPWAGFSSDLANSYIVDVPEFWQFLDASGFDVHYVELVPRDLLDRHYAYYFATRQG